MNPQQDIDRNAPHFAPDVSRKKAELDKLQANAMEHLPKLRDYVPPVFNDQLARMYINRRTAA